MSFKLDGFRSLTRNQMIAGGIAIVFLYALFISTLSTHPGGSYVDESCEAYNGYLIAKTGVAENGVSFPLFFQCYTQGYTQWMSPELIYSLAGMYTVVPPSVLSARILSASMMFLVTLLLGVLAVRLSGRPIVGVIVAITAMATPWFYEVSRLIQETSPLALSITLFLFFLYNASQREKWKVYDPFLLALSLCLITYAYASGRMLAPLFGLGLLIFVNNKRIFLDVVKTGALYAITLIPFFYVYFNNPGAIAGRFRAATNMSADKSYFENALTVFGALLSDMSPTFFILEGDQHNRHHIPAMGEILIATFALGLLGIVIILIKHRGSRWWRYILYGSVACLLPGAVTYERHHAVRGIGFPIFFTLLTVPAIVWLLGSSKEKAESDGTEHKDAEPASASRRLLGNEGSVRRALLYCLLVLTLVQAVAFQVKFYEIGDDRSGEFDHPYLKVLEMALATDSRPIYLDEGNEPAYVHALWYGTIKGLPRSSFYHLLDGQLPPYGGLVINSGPCLGECEVIYTEGLYTLYQSLVPNAGPPPEETPAVVTLGSGPGQFSLPHGLTIDANGFQYVADTDNARIQKLDAAGNFVSEFGTKGTDQGQLSQPHGVAVNQAGEVFITDSSRHALLKFNADGQFVKEWRDPEVPFYGPRDIALAADGNLYIVDQGLARIVKFNTATEQFTSWGTQGPAEGQFEGLTGVGVGGGFVYTTDAGSDRVQVFDTNGKFIRQWSVPQWQKDWYTFPDVAYDEVSKRVFVSSGKTNDILVYDTDGQFLSSIKPQPPSGLCSPSALEITKGPNGNRLMVLNISNNIAGVGNPGIVMIDIAKTKAEKVR